MKIQVLIIPVLLLASLFAEAEKSAKERVTLCHLPVTRESQEATFTVVYMFEVKGGRPVAIRKVENDLLPDAEFTSCISGWTLPGVAGSVTAEFSYKMAEGWTEMTVSGKNFKRQITLNK